MLSFLAMVVRSVGCFLPTTPWLTTCNKEHSWYSGRAQHNILCLQRARLRAHTPGKAAAHSMSRAVCVQTKIFDSLGSGAVCVGRFNGGACLRSIHNARVGSKPIIAHYLIEFPDDDLLFAARDAYARVRLLCLLLSLSGTVNAAVELPKLLLSCQCCC